MLNAATSLSRSSLLDGYAPRPGSYDELLAPDGRLRPHWTPLLDDMAAAGPDALAARFAAADRHLRSSGVYYRVYDTPDGGERPWPLAPVPLVLSAEDWAGIRAGVAERAALLETVLADLYGPASLVAQGLIPAPLVAGNPDFLRPLVGVPPRGGQRIMLYAADLGRGPDGRWWVLGDRTGAPSGMGYALENRLAVAQAFPALARDMHVERLAPFFQAVRDSLSAKASREGARIGLLTPGPATETYFEHSYLARYLGFLLVEGGDLAVQDGSLHVRTIEGLKRLDVLLRRLDADFCDPLELAGTSRLGVPGLVGAVRSGSLALANALGAGLVEAPALLAVLPAVARAILGRDLALPAVPTLWCGAEAGRAALREEARRLILRPAFGRALPDLPAAGRAVDAGDADRLAGRSLELAVQDRFALSTMPVWQAGFGRLVPQPFSLRVFAVATEGGWTVMPGGFARTAVGDGAPSMRGGSLSADVWVRSDAPVEPVTLLPQGRVAIRRVLGHLPARAADNLFWLGRYLERLETALRLAAVLAELAGEEADAAGSAPTRLVALVRALGIIAAAPDAAAVTEPPALDTVVEAALSGDGDAAVPALVLAVGRTAAAIRERLAPDSLHALADLKAFAGATELPPAERADRMLRVLAALSGLAQENMNRISGWRFLQVGRRLERGMTTARLARRLADPAAEPDVLDALLAVADSRMTYRSRYLMGTLRAPVLDLVILDDGNPRSAAFQLGRLVEHAAALPGDESLLTDFTRLADETAAAAPAALDETWLLGLENRLAALSNRVTGRYFGATVAAGEVESLG